MSKAEQTRQFIIEKSAPLFNIKGYDSTSLSDVQDATGLTKGAIYGNFSDKNELAVAAFEYNSSATYSRIKAAMDEQTTAYNALLAYTNYYIQNWQGLFKRGGCPMLNAAVEADDHLDFLRNSVRKSMSRVMKNLRLTIEKGQQQKEFKKTVSAENYAAVIFTIIEGGILLAKAMNNPEYLQIATDRINLIINCELIL